MQNYGWVMSRTLTSGLAKANVVACDDHDRAVASDGSVVRAEIYWRAEPSDIDRLRLFTAWQIWWPLPPDGVWIPSVLAGRRPRR